MSFPFLPTWTFISYIRFKYVHTTLMGPLGIVLFLEINYIAIKTRRAFSLMHSSAWSGPEFFGFGFELHEIFGFGFVRVLVKLGFQSSGRVRVSKKP